MRVNELENDNHTPTETEWLTLKDLLALTDWPRHS